MYIKPLTKKELEERIALNYQRLCDPYYQIDQVYSDPEYDWPGDKEGRALLAFVCHYNMSGKKNPCLEPLLETLDIHTNQEGYFGPLFQLPVFEQQLSGHNWLLRGLCEAYRSFGNPDYLKKAANIVRNLYMPTFQYFSDYPIDRKEKSGDVSGKSGNILGNWNLSTDIGCAFMSIDGLSDYYAITKDPETMELLNEMICIFSSIDLVGLNAQTHCTLTACRGIMRLYNITKEEQYKNLALKIWNTYETSGMTYSYQNFNWWGKGDTWTEPCAIVDSLILSIQLWQTTHEKKYLTMARRIWHNGMASSQRPNGGAGTDTTVSPTTDFLKSKMYEAFFCCTMRLAEGLYWAQKYQNDLSAEMSGNIKIDSAGRYVDGDILYGEVTSCLDLTELPEWNEKREAEGHTLLPLVKYYRLTDKQITEIQQKILF